MELAARGKRWWRARFVEVTEQRENWTHQIAPAALWLATENSCALPSCTPRAMLRRTSPTAARPPALVVALVLSTAGALPVIGTEHPKQLKVLITTHGVPSFSTYFEAFEPFFHTGAPAMYPGMGVHREVIFKSPTDDRLFSLLWFEEGEEDLEITPFFNADSVEMKALVGAGVALTPIIFETYASSAIFGSSTVDDVPLPMPGSNFTQPHGWPDDVPSIDGYMLMVDCPTSRWRREGTQALGGAQGAASACSMRGEPAGPRTGTTPPEVELPLRPRRSLAVEP